MKLNLSFKPDYIVEKLRRPDTYDLVQVALLLSRQGEQTKIYGGTPKNKELIEGWIKAAINRNSAWKNLPNKDEIIARFVQEHMDEYQQVKQVKQMETQPETEQEATEEMRDRVSQTFRMDPFGIYQADYCIFAQWKQSASLLGLNGSMPGLKEFIKEGCQLFDSKVRFLRADVDDSMEWCDIFQTIDSGDFDVINKVDGFEDFPGHVDGLTGPRSILSRHEYVEGALMCYTVQLLNRTRYLKENKRGSSRKSVNNLPLNIVRDIVMHGELLGIGARRSQGAGKHTVMGIRVLHPQTEKE